MSAGDAVATFAVAIVATGIFLWLCVVFGRPRWHR